MSSADNTKNGYGIERDPALDEEWGAWLEATYDPDNGHVDRLEDTEL